MDNLTVKEIIKIGLWLITAPIWFPIIWIHRKWKKSRG